MTAVTQRMFGAPAAVFLDVRWNDSDNEKFIIATPTFKELERGFIRYYTG